MHRDMRYWAMACWMGAMAHQVCVVLSTAERERLAAIVADRNRPRKQRVAAVRSQLDDVKRGDAVRAGTAQFATEIGLARIERRDGFGDRGIFVGPVKASARQQLDRAAVEPRMHAIAVVFDFVQPARSVRRRVDELGQLRPDPVRQGRRSSATPAGYGARHAGSGQGLLCGSMALFTPGQATVVRYRRRLPIPTTGSPDYRTVCSPANEPSRKYPAWLASRPDRVRKRAPNRNIRDSIS